MLEVVVGCSRHLSKPTREISSVSALCKKLMPFGHPCGALASRSVGGLGTEIGKSCHGVRADHLGTAFVGIGPVMAGCARSPATMGGLHFRSDCRRARRYCIQSRHHCHCGPPSAVRIRGTLTPQDLCANAARAVSPTFCCFGHVTSRSSVCCRPQGVHVNGDKLTARFVGLPLFHRVTTVPDQPSWAGGHAVGSVFCLVASIVASEMVPCKCPGQENVSLQFSS